MTPSLPARRLFSTVTASIALLFLLSSCSWFLPKVVGTLDAGFTPGPARSVASRGPSGGVVEELWLVELARGVDSVIPPGAVRAAEVFVPRANGQFSVTIPATGAEYAIIAARPGESDRKDQIAAIFSFTVDSDSGSMILPTAGLSGTFEMGRVRFASGEGVSERSVGDNSGALSDRSIALLRGIADADNSVIALINDHVNYRGPTDYYLPELTVGYGGPTVAALSAGTASSADFMYSSIGAAVFSPDSATQLTFRSPSGTMQGSSGNFGSGSAAKWGISLADPAVEQGWWQLLNASNGSVLAEFDLTLGFPLDGDGAPLSPVPLPLLVLDGSGNVTGMTLRWVTSDGSGSMDLSDPAALDFLVGKTEFFLSVSGAFPQKTYMFDEVRGSQSDPRMFGDMLGFTFDDPIDWSQVSEMTISYRFGFYRVSVGFRN